VVNAGKTSSDYILEFTVTDFDPTVDLTSDLIGTLYHGVGGENRIFNGGQSLVLETTGAVTLPKGGTITEGVVTSNPTIQLTPARPDVVSQKLVIKGGGGFTNTVANNDIQLSVSDLTAIVGDTVYFYVEGSDTYANQTLYWWTYPENLGVADTNSGTVAIDGDGDGTFNILIDRDDYEFTVRVSPIYDQYDPDNVGVESKLINASAPTYSDYHLHLTTGNLTETSIFLGTDDHNVRTTIDGGIQVTTPGETNRVWEFDTAGDLTIPGNIRSEGNIDIEINLSDSTQRRWSFGEDGGLAFPDASVQTTAYPGGGYGLPVCVINSSDGYGQGGGGEVSVNFTVTNPSGAAITEIGIFLPSVTTEYAVQLAASNTAGTQDKVLSNLVYGDRYWAQVYAVTANGTAYSKPNYLAPTQICLLAGTMIAMADGTHKAIEDITYTDRMLSWDFDRGCYAETTALWIKRCETGSEYNLLTFSDGTTLRTFDQHRIFNKQAGAFTYPMTDATPIGTITVNEHGEEITLISKQVVVDTIEYYNVITDHHMNLFSDTVLTSCRFNNIYPILDMKFVKDSRILRTRDEFENIPDRFFYGLRLAEQTYDLDMIEWYVTRLLSVEQSFELAAV
jgi:hypothetical protein